MKYLPSDTSLRPRPGETAEQTLDRVVAAIRRDREGGLFDDFENDGLARAERVTGEWCRCETSDGQEAYYRRENGHHGWFHDPQLGGCGGITQTG